nr:hypothetical protein CFP56_75544 [Quercus suber]
MDRHDTSTRDGPVTSRLGRVNRPFHDPVDGPGMPKHSAKSASWVCLQGSDEAEKRGIGQANAAGHSDVAGQMPSSG